MKKEKSKVRRYDAETLFSVYGGEEFDEFQDVGTARELAARRGTTPEAIQQAATPAGQRKYTGFRVYKSGRELLPLATRLRRTINTALAALAEADDGAYDAYSAGRLSALNDVKARLDECEAENEYVAQMEEAGLYEW